MGRIPVRDTCAEFWGVRRLVVVGRMGGCSGFGCHKGLGG